MLDPKPDDPYITSIPGEMTSFFMYEGRPCVVYEHNGERKGAYFVP